MICVLLTPHPFFFFFNSQAEHIALAVLSIKMERTLKFLMSPSICLWDKPGHSRGAHRDIGDWLRGYALTLTFLVLGYHEHIMK